MGNSEEDSRLPMPTNRVETVAKHRITIVVWSALSAALFLPVVLTAALASFPGALEATASAVRVPHADCGACGMTRAYLSLVHGEVSAAYSLNAVAPFLFFGSSLNAGLALAYWLSRGLSSIKRG